MKRILAILLSLVMLLSLCGCGARAKSAPVPAPEAYTEYSYAANGYLGDKVAYEESAYDTAGLSMSRAASSAQAKGSGGEDAPDEDPDKIIYSSNVTVETTAFDEALGKVGELVARFDGWIESSSVNGANYYDISRGRSSTRSASYTLRIPGERFDELMGSFSELGNVPYTNIYTENVTAQYYDAQAHMNAYKTQEARLLEMMEVAESVEDIILLEDRLTELRYQIESLESTLLNWDRRVSYSTVYLQLNEVREYTPDTPVQLRYGERLGRAFRDGLGSVGSFFKEALLWLVQALPTLVIFAVLLIVLLPVGRRLHTKGKARRAAKKAAKAEKQKSK